MIKLDGTVLNDTDEVSLSNNAPLFLSDRETYSLDGMQVENFIDPGGASLMKGLLTYSSTMNKQNTLGWILETKDIMTYKINKYTRNRKGLLKFCIPLTHNFGFAECYYRVIYEKKTHSKSIQLSKKQEFNSIHLFN